MQMTSFLRKPRTRSSLLKACLVRCAVSKSRRLASAHLTNARRACSSNPTKTHQVQGRDAAMKLYDSVGPNPRVVRMFMAEKGIEMPKQAVDLRKGENRE